MDNIAVYISIVSLFIIDLIIAAMIKILKEDIELTNKIFEYFSKSIIKKIQLQNKEIIDLKEERQDRKDGR